MKYKFYGTIYLGISMISIWIGIAVQNMANLILYCIRIGQVFKGQTQHL